MKLEISLAPSGDLRLHLPTRGRFLDITATPYGLAAIQKILRDGTKGKPERGKEQPGYIAEFPTQAVIDIWMREETIRRQEIAAVRAQEERVELENELGISLDKLELRL